FRRFDHVLHVWRYRERLWPDSGRELQDCRRVDTPQPPAIISPRGREPWGHLRTADRGSPDGRYLVGRRHPRLGTLAEDGRMVKSSAPRAGAATAEAGCDTELRIQLLGGFHVWVGSRAVPEAAWSRRRAASLVKLLAL